MVEWLFARRIWWLVGLALLGGYALGRRSAGMIPYPDLALRSGMHLLQRRRSVLALGALPGEVEREIGGTLWRFKQAGARVSVAVAPQPAGTRQNTREVTLRELEQAQAVLGYDRARLLPECKDASDIAPLMAAIAELWDEEAPDLVVIPVGGPAPQATLHQAALAVATERGETGRLGLYGSQLPNTLIDVNQALQKKWAGVRAYPSALTGPDAVHRWSVSQKGKRFSGGVPSQATEGLYRL